MTCKWCGLTVTYLRPPLPGDTVTDVVHYYQLDWGRVWSSMTLVDSTGSTICRGSGALSQPGVSIGQLPAHKV